MSHAQSLIRKERWKALSPEQQAKRIAHLKRIARNRSKTKPPRYKANNPKKVYGVLI